MLHISLYVVLFLLHNFYLKTFYNFNLAFKILLLTKDGQVGAASADISGTSSNGGKSFLNNAKWKIIALLTLLLIAILLASVILFVLRNNTGNFESNFQTQNLSNLGLLTSTISTTTIKNTIKSTTIEEGLSTKKFFTTFTPQLDDIQVPSQSQYNSACQISENFVSCSSVQKQNR